jgi:hypothetical protein
MAADMLVLLGDHNLEVITFPVHTRNISHSLSLFLFSAFKTRKSRTKGDFDSNTTNDQINNIR